MTDIAKIRRLIKDFSFDSLFEELGWDRFNRELPIFVDEVEYMLTRDQTEATEHSLQSARIRSVQLGGVISISQSDGGRIGQRDCYRSCGPR